MDVQVLPCVAIPQAARSAADDTLGPESRSLLRKGPRSSHRARLLGFYDSTDSSPTACRKAHSASWRNTHRGQPFGSGGTGAGLTADAPAADMERTRRQSSRPSWPLCPRELSSGLPVRRVRQRTPDRFRTCAPSTVAGAKVAENSPATRKGDRSFPISASTSISDFSPGDRNGDRAETRWPADDDVAVRIKGAPETVAVPLLHAAPPCRGSPRAGHRHAYACTWK